MWKHNPVKHRFLGGTNMRRNSLGSPVSPQEQKLWQKETALDSQCNPHSFMTVIHVLQINDVQV